MSRGQAPAECRVRQPTFLRSVDVADPPVRRGSEPPSASDAFVNESSLWARNGMSKGPGTREPLLSVSANYSVIELFWARSSLLEGEVKSFSRRSGFYRRVELQNITV